MIYDNALNQVKNVFLVIIAAMLIACGGGRATTSSTDDAVTIPSDIPPVNGVGSATLSWLPPTAYSDGSAITELSGHNVYINSGSGYTRVASINNPSVTTYVVENLSSGTHVFVVTAFDSQGVESSYSTEASVVIGS